MPKWYQVELTQLLAVFADKYGGENSIWRLQIEAMQRTPTSEGCVFLPHL
jgi:hypothetical protein